METQKTIPQNIDAYISMFPLNIQERLNELRMTIKKIAPDAEEVISYQMPAFKYHGILVYFAAHTHHIGFYPRTTVIEVFKHELSAYKSSKGTIQFPNDRPLPLELIQRIVEFRLQENLGLAQAKARKKK